MVKRFVTFLFLFVFLLILLVCPVLAADVIQGESDNFGFSYDDSNIFFVTNRLPGNMLGVDTQLLSVSKLYFYIPVSKPVVSLDFNFTLFKTTGNVTYDSCDWGTIASNEYNYREALSRPAIMWLGSNSISGSSARTISYKVSFTDLPFSTSNSYRFIRIVFDIADGDNSLILWLNKSLDQNLSGVLGNPTYSFSGSTSSLHLKSSGGELQCDGYYITGSIKDKYYNGTSVVSDTRYLQNGTSGSAGYLKVPSHVISQKSPFYFDQTEGLLLSGNLTPSSASQDTDLQGTYLSRTYVDTVTMSATRSYSDQELIQAVDDGFAQNHSDLQAISNQLGELVQHQDQVNQTGDDIGSTTSDSSISSTSGDLSSGSDGLSNVLSTASNISSVSGAAAPYISFIGAAMPIILNFGNGVLAWAVIGIIACSVFLWILKKVAE